MLTSKRAYPRPPIWNRDINTICPKVVSVTETSIGDSPVTQTAEVATNETPENLIFSFDEMGSNSNIVPITIKDTKPIASKKEDGIFLILCLNFEISIDLIITFFLSLFKSDIVN